MTTQTQVALSKVRDLNADREVLCSNLEEFERLSAMIGGMLFLAQTDRSSIVVIVQALDHGEPCPMGAVPAASLFIMPSCCIFFSLLIMRFFMFMGSPCFIMPAAAEAG